MSANLNASSLVAQATWLNEIGKTDVTAWRWRKRGWLPPAVNIYGKLYLRRSDIAEFERRAEAGEFAVPTRAPQVNKEGRHE